MWRRHKGKHRAPREEAQPEAGIDPAAEPPEQPDKLVTGGEALEVQQQDPELDDNTGSRP